MSDTVTMFGEELTFVPFDEATRVVAHWSPDSGECLGVSELCAGRWSGYLHDLATHSIEARHPQDAATQFESLISEAALRLPADVWARMVERRGEVDRG